MYKIPTRTSLFRRGVLTPLNCVMCQDSDEYSQHLFLGCIVVQRVWVQCFRWIEITFVQHNYLMSHFEYFVLPYGSLKQNLVWKGMWAAVVWSIWDQRNHNVFRQGKVDAKEIFQMAQLKTWLWMKHRVDVFNYSFSNWHLNPLICIKKGLGFRV